MGWRGVHNKTQKQQNKITTKPFLNYVVTSLKFRLPTWRLHTTKPYDSKARQTPSDSEWLLNSKWFNQQPLLSEKQLGDKEISTYFNCDFSTLQLLLLTLWSRSSSVVGNGDRSDGRSLCWDDIDAEDFVVVVVVIKRLVGGGGYWSGDCSSHFHN